VHGDHRHELDPEHGMLRRLGCRLRRAARDESGFTFPEIAVAIVLATLTAAVGMTIVMFAVRAEPARSDRAADIADARAMVERIGREVRQGETVTNATATELTLLTRIPGSSCTGSTTTGVSALCRVTYTCGTSCTRTVRNPDGTGSAPPEVLVRGLTGSTVFSYPTSIYSAAPCPVPAGASAPSTANPEYVCLELAFPAEGGDDSVTLTDGIALRNWFQP
jgi:hypothetical protein